MIKPGLHHIGERKTLNIIFWMIYVGSLMTEQRKFLMYCQIHAGHSGRESFSSTVLMYPTTRRKYTTPAIITNKKQMKRICKYLKLMKTRNLKLNELSLRPTMFK